MPVALQYVAAAPSLTPRQMRCFATMIVYSARSIAFTECGFERLGFEFNVGS